MSDIQKLLNDAISTVMADIDSRNEWCEEVSHGKMFGVLLVECPEDHCSLPFLEESYSSLPFMEGPEGYALIKAYSGQICGRSDWDGYVPAIFDYLQPDGYFKRHEADIVALTRQMETADEPQRLLLREQRASQSAELQRWLFSQFKLCNPDGKEQSVLDVFTDWATQNHSKQILPPGGTGECCAPKLLHYANKHRLRPVALAEFWYGASPKGEIRHHGMQYEPCQAKCVPILPYLIGNTPLTFQQPKNNAALELGEVLYEDEWIIAVDKPAGMLSVPGKRDSYCAEKILNENRLSLTLTAIPDAEYWKMVHRLDMDTSGVIIAAKDLETYKAMQKLFALHEEVQKEYIAILSCGNSSAAGGYEAVAGDCKDSIGRYDVSSLPKEGIISLPLTADFYNRPRQMVDHEHGKESVTRYEFINPTSDNVLSPNHLMVRLFPLTGRTHQLRMHCAHPEGLGMPIVGDRLYGCENADRMYLHAHRITFRHPHTGDLVTIEAPLPPKWEHYRNYLANNFVV